MLSKQALSIHRAARETFPSDFRIVTGLFLYKLLAAVPEVPPGVIILLV